MFSVSKNARIPFFRHPSLLLRTRPSNLSLQINNRSSPVSANNTVKLDNNRDNGDEDDNGNRTASVAEIRRRFDVTVDKPKPSTNGLLIEGTKPISENRFKKLDVDNKPRKTISNGDRPILNGDVNVLNGEENGENEGRALGGAQDSTAELGKNHTSNFASYIWSKDFRKEEEEEEEEKENRVGFCRVLFDR